VITGMMGRVVYVTRLVIFVEVDETVADPRQMSLSARHEAVLSDGGRVLLLADRGWSASGPPDIWAVTSVEEITDTARMVVGPDERFGSRSQKDMEADHWASLAVVLRRQGVEADAPALGRLPHDVVLGQRLLERIGPQSNERLRWRSCVALCAWPRREQPAGSSTS
jgi:hypothetical protein